MLFRRPSGGHERSYWIRTGLAEGTERYDRYLTLFGLTRDSLAGRVVCDYGCGPFGGVLSVLRNVRKALPVDVLARYYNAWRRCRYPILPVRTRAGNRLTEIPGGSCDAVFCCNMLDHGQSPVATACEITRITKPGGTCLLFVHLRSWEQISKHHTLIGVRQVERWFGRLRRLGVKRLRHSDRLWTWDWRKEGPDYVNEELHLRAMWGVLTRSEEAF